MIDQLTEFFSPFCCLNEITLEVKQVDFPKKTFFSVKMENKDNPPRKISGGFFPSDTKQKIEEDKLFLLKQARNLFLPPSL